MSPKGLFSCLKLTSFETAKGIMLIWLTTEKILPSLWDIDVYSQMVICDFFFCKKGKGKCQIPHTLVFMREETDTVCQSVTKRKVWEALSILSSINPVNLLSSRYGGCMAHYRE